MLLFTEGFETFAWRHTWRPWGIAANMGNVDQDDRAFLKIVHGMDTTVNPPKPYARKGGRALLTDIGLWGEGIAFRTPIRPSRTVYTGAALRWHGNPVGYCVKFYYKTRYSHNDGYYDGQASSLLGNAANATKQIAAACHIAPHANGMSLNIKWSFLGATSHNDNLAMNVNLLNGEFHYVQIGFTLMGNIASQPQAWCEVRVGGRAAKIHRLDNIMTGYDQSSPDAIFSINAVGINPGRVSETVSSRDYWQQTIDDVYIANDEGEYNNTFLGNIYVRRMLPSAEGTDNDAQPYGTAYRHEAVDADFVDPTNPLPTPEPTPEQDPLYISWETGVSDYVTLLKRGDRQLFRFHHIEFLGAEPRIIGVVMSAMMCTASSGLATTLKAVRKLGVADLIESHPMDAPLVGNQTTVPEVRKFCWDNDEIVHSWEVPQTWSATSVNESEWGFAMESVDIAPYLYDHGLNRLNIVITDTLEEILCFVDFPNRYIEEVMAESLVLAEANERDYTWHFEDVLHSVESLDYTRSFRKFVPDDLRFDDIIPWTYMWAHDVFGMEDELFMQWHDAVEDDIAVEDWASGFWEELFTDEVSASEAVVASYIETLSELFDMAEPYLWSGHELIEDEFAIDADEPWDNHELMEEYLYPDDDVANGFKLDIDDSLEIEEAHYDAWWVELFYENVHFVDSILTQHWRYDKLFGLVLSSWQVSPVEQEGQDGNHNGDNPWGW